MRVCVCVCVCSVFFVVVFIILYVNFLVGLCCTCVWNIIFRLICIM